MRWNEIIVEGSDFHCPECDDYLGKSSEVLHPANAPAYCGRCGWTDGKKASKSPVEIEKTSGDYTARINSTKTQASLHYNGPTVSLIRSGDKAGDVTMRSKGVWTAYWQIHHDHPKRIPGEFSTMTQAVNAVKNAHKAKVREYQKQTRQMAKK